MKTINSATLDGFEAISVAVEASFSKALPAFSIVGLATASIQESKDRIKAALLSCEFKFPPLKITVNLSPSEVYKTGSHFDLPIALLIALQQSPSFFDSFYVFGELGLDGKLKDTDSIYVLILSLMKQNKLTKVFIPKQSIPKISKLPNIEIYACESLKEAIDCFRENLFEQYKIGEPLSIGAKSIDIQQQTYYYDMAYNLDFLDIKGQEVAKRAALIAAAGNHNLLLEGSPGCGKSMIAKRLQGIMPPMSLEEILEKAKIESMDAKEPTFSPTRTFRSPHHSSTKASIFGGGTNGAKIGEIAIANNGILFFDELPHFSKTILEALREPLEDNKLLISRVHSKIEYPTSFLFVGAMNPCPCGNLLSQNKLCRCNELELKRYKNRLSEPFLDRIDLYVQMAEVSLNDKASISSKEFHEMVIKAFIQQKKRKQNVLNGKLNDKEIKTFCTLDDASQKILEQASITYALSFRAINKILKIARTIADLDLSDTLTKTHLLEALSYRKRW